MILIEHSNTMENRQSQNNTCPASYLIYESIFYAVLWLYFVRTCHVCVCVHTCWQASIILMFVKKQIIYCCIGNESTHINCHNPHGDVCVCINCIYSFQCFDWF